MRLLQTVGFPIVVCGWFMFRLEGYMKAQTEALQEVARQLARINPEE